MRVFVALRTNKLELYETSLVQFAALVDSVHAEPDDQHQHDAHDQYRRLRHHVWIEVREEAVWILFLLVVRVVLSVRLMVEVVLVVWVVRMVGVHRGYVVVAIIHWQAQWDVAVLRVYVDPLAAVDRVFWWLEVLGSTQMFRSIETLGTFLVAQIVTLSLLVWLNELLFLFTFFWLGQHTKVFSVFSSDRVTGPLL